MAGIAPEFERRGVKIIGISVDPVSDHAKWQEDIKVATGHTVGYPLIGDRDLKIAKLYQMLPAAAGNSSDGRTPADNATVRSVYTAKHQVATPANWRQGDDVIITPAVSNEEAASRFGSFETVLPYLRTTKQPRA